MASRFGFLCPNCWNHVGKTCEELDSVEVCVICSEDYRACKRLYTVIVGRHPTLKSLPVNKVFERVYDELMKERAKAK